MNQINAIERLRNEKKLLKQDLPEGFFARPVPVLKNGEVSKTDQNYLIWICGIPGRKQTLWENSKLLMYMFFSDKYPAEAPKCQFDPPLPHPNIYPSGSVCLSLINQQQGWKPQITIKEILLGVQLLLNEPNLNSPAQQEAYDTLKSNKKKYDQNIIEFCTKYPTADFDSRVMTLVRNGEFRTAPKAAPQQPQQSQQNRGIIDIQ